ncbi:MAG: ribose 5-phosphate isomerase A [Candidatus Aenigmarchaeota archaeon]|nr:ribose 5-phosphate isomerase A [Candidatus Aenigmarchaeota archaeon]
MRGSDSDALKKMAAIEAAKLVQSGQIAGLGSGSTCKFLLEELGRRAKNGLEFFGIPTSRETKKLAKEQGLKVLPAEKAEKIDIAIDGADEIDPELNLIKGYGGALLREKVVASKAGIFVVIADESKMVKRLGKKGILPIEISKDSYPGIIDALKDFKPALRNVNGKPFITDSGNFILDLNTGKTDLSYAERRLKKTSGVLETGLFILMASHAIIGTKRGVMHLRPKNAHYEAINHGNVS